MSDLQKSRICRDGAPDVRHPGCTGCLGCPCHHVPAPTGADGRPSLRERYERRVAELHPKAGEQRADGAA